MLLIIGIPAALGIIAAGLGLIIKDQARKRRGEPRSHEVWEAQRKERIEAERALIQKHSPTNPPAQQRPKPPSRP